MQPAHFFFGVFYGSKRRGKFIALRRNWSDHSLQCESFRSSDFFSLQIYPGPSIATISSAVGEKKKPQSRKHDQQVISVVLQAGLETCQVRQTFGYTLMKKLCQRSEGSLLLVSGGPHDIFLSVKCIKDLVTSTHLTAQFSKHSWEGRRQRSAGKLLACTDFAVLVSHRITDQLRLEGTSGDHRFQPPFLKAGSTCSGLCPVGF